MMPIPPGDPSMNGHVGRKGLVIRDTNIIDTPITSAHVREAERTREKHAPRMLDRTLLPKRPPGAR